MNSDLEVCVDASVAIKVVVAEPDSEKADALFEAWANEERRLIAPAFFEVEVDSILRQKTSVRKELTAEQAEAAWTKLQRLPIQPLSLPGQRQRAWELAAILHLTTVYDATYLAIAELRGCEFWTADERLFNRVKDTLFFVRWLRHYKLTAQSQ